MEDREFNYENIDQIVEEAEALGLQYAFRWNYGMCNQGCKSICSFVQ